MSAATRAIVVKLLVEVEADVADSPTAVGRVINAAANEALHPSLRKLLGIGAVVLDRAREDRGEAGWVPIADVLGSAVVPQPVAEVIEIAIHRLRTKGKGPDGNSLAGVSGWRALELLVADWLSGR